ncbi:hypothetical protein FOA52_005789 [Chlamydomonas sp. UWO 241]|nr:hypothetical protein FOA52_005789 [Chlamydomonas sp. UWO 241]
MLARRSIVSTSSHAPARVASRAGHATVATQRPCRLCHAPRRQRVSTASSEPGKEADLLPEPTPEELREMAALGLSMADFDGLLPEEDDTVPGTYFDALNGNTKLGKAVKAACVELNHLNAMEIDILQQAEVLLKKLGVKTPIVAAAPVAAVVAEEEEEEEGEEAGQPGPSA